MINKIKLYVILGIISLIVGLIVYYSTTYTLIKKKIINQKVDSISTLKIEIKKLDSTRFSLQQDVDISKGKDKQYETVIAGLTAENKRLRNAENTCCEELKHAEETGGIIRYNWLGKVKKKK